MKIGFAYLRVSSEEQRKKKSVGDQEFPIETYCQRNDIGLKKTFKDDGFDGNTIEKRPAFVEMMGYFDTEVRRMKGEDPTIETYLLATFPDRIGRMPYEAVNQLLNLLIATKINVIATSDGVDDGDVRIYRMDKEEAVAELHQALWAARKWNLDHGKKVSLGHKKRRRDGFFSGGRVPIGISYNIIKDEEGNFLRGEFDTVPGEHETLKTIFRKLYSGLGTPTLVKYLNANIDKYPLRKYRTAYRKDIPSKGIKRGDPKPHLWTGPSIDVIVNNDFYHTGIIQPTAESKKKGLKPIDTGIKLFDKELVMAVRRERRLRVYTKRDDDKVESIDAYLLLGFGRCSCGRRLSIRSDRRNKKVIRRFYTCQGRYSAPDLECRFKQEKTAVLDHNFWKAFVTSFKDKFELQERVFQDSYIVDTDIAMVTAKLENIETECDQLDFKKKNVLYQHTEGYIDDGELEEQMQEVNGRKDELNEEKIKCELALNRREDVEEAIENAVKFVSDQIDLIEALEQHGEEDPELVKKVDRYFADLDEVYLTGEQVKRLVNRLKRAIIQRYVDPEKGVEIYDKDHFIIHGVLGKDVKIQKNGLIDL